MGVSISRTFTQPFLGLQKRAKKYGELVDGYKILFYDLQDIRQKVEEDKKYDSQHKKLFKAAKERRKRLEVTETGISQSKRLKKKCQQMVKLEFSTQQFYLPMEE